MSLLPDAGKDGWLAMVTGFLCFMFTYGFMRSWPLYFKPIADYLHANQHIPNGTHVDLTQDQIADTSTILIFTFAIGAMSCGVFLPLLTNRRCITAGALAIVSIFVANYFLLLNGKLIIIVSLFALLGVAFGIINTAGVNLVSKKIKPEDKAFAYSFSTLGATSALVTFPHIMTWSEGKFGVTGSMLVIAGMFCAIMLLSLKFQKTKKLALEVPRIWDTQIIWKRPAFRWYLITACAFVWPAFWGSSAIVVEYLDKSFGMQLDQAKTVLSLMGMGEAIGRLISLPVGKRVRDEYVLMSCFTLEGFLWLGLTLLDAEQSMFGTSLVNWFGLAIGFSRGFFAGPFWALLAHTITVSEHAVSTGMFQTLGGVGNAVAIYGFNKLLSVNVHYAIYITGGLYLATNLGLWRCKHYRDIMKDSNISLDDELEDDKATLEDTRTIVVKTALLIDAQRTSETDFTSESGLVI